MGKPKIKAYCLYQDKSFDIKKGKIEANQIKFGKKDSIQFDTENIFMKQTGTGLLSRLNPFKMPQKYVFYIDGAVKALKFRKNTNQIMTDWTKPEAKHFTEKTVAQTLAEMNPITWAQFFILLIPIILTLVIVLFK